jgi:plastocyanin
MRKWQTIAVGSVIGILAFVVATVSPLVAGSTAPAGASIGSSAISIVGGGGACTSTFCYQPSQLTVAPGTTVSWTNRTVADHTVTRCATSACPGSGPGTGGDPAFNSGVLLPGKTFSLVLHGVGTYNYYCQIHGFATMRGTVTVSSFFVSTTTLPRGDVGTAYSAMLHVTGGVAPYTWSVTAGSLPAGLKLSSGGKITGTPTKSGTSGFTVGVSDSSKPAMSAWKPLSIGVTT